MWPAINSRPPVTWGCRWLVSDCSTSRAIFDRSIDKEGAQQALYPYNDPGQLPITPVRRPNGEWLRLEIELPGYSVWLRAWQAHVGRVRLYLLDSNDAANVPVHRGITSQLYGGGRSCGSSRKSSWESGDGGCLQHSESNRKSAT